MDSLSGATVENSCSQGGGAAKPCGTRETAIDPKPNIGGGGSIDGGGGSSSGGGSSGGRSGGRSAGPREPHPRGTVGVAVLSQAQRMMQELALVNATPALGLLEAAELLTQQLGVALVRRARARWRTRGARARGRPVAAARGRAPAHAAPPALPPASRLPTASWASRQPVPPLAAAAQARASPPAAAAAPRCSSRPPAWGRPCWSAAAPQGDRSSRRTPNARRPLPGPQQPGDGLVTWRDSRK